MININDHSPPFIPAALPVKAVTLDDDTTVLVPVTKPLDWFSSVVGSRAAVIDDVRVGLLGVVVIGDDAVR